MGLLIALISLSLLGVLGVEWIPLTPTYTPIPAAMSIMTDGTVTQAYTVATMPAVTVIMASASLMML